MSEFHVDNSGPAFRGLVSSGTIRPLKHQFMMLTAMRLRFRNLVVSFRVSLFGESTFGLCHKISKHVLTLHKGKRKTALLTGLKRQQPDFRSASLSGISLVADIGSQLCHRFPCQASGWFFSGLWGLFALLIASSFLCPHRECTVAVKLKTRQSRVDTKALCHSTTR